MNPELPLRDIHLPVPVGWWPPAPGWYVLPVAVLMLAILSWWIWRRLTRVTVRKATLRQLEVLTKSSLSPAEQLREAATLLRRASLSAYPREDVAGLTGEDWLRFLDRQMQDRHFSEGAGRLLLDAPYRPHVDADLGEFLALCREWAKRLPTVVLRKPGRA